MKPYPNYKQAYGFTLVELSIVLVVIGLLVAGVLVGRDLIASAQMRSILTDIEKYNAAANTFKLKYNCLPGDCPAAASFGFASRAGSTGRGDGTLLIEGALSTSNTLCGEVVLFWSDLSGAGLVRDSFIGTDGGLAGPPCYATGLTADQLVPKTRFKSAYITVYPHSTRRNYFQITNVSDLYTSGFSPNYGYVTQDYAITAMEAYQLDAKADDGYPTTGKVYSTSIAIGAGGPNTGFFAAPAANVCGDNTTTPYSYNTTSDYAESDNKCTLGVEASF